MDNTYNIKIEKLNHKFKDYESMEKKLYIDDIEKLKKKSGMTSLLLLYTIMICFVITILTDILGILSILILILCSVIILLYYLIITDIIIPDKLKETYEKAYYVYGYVLNEPVSSVEIIEEIFFKLEEADDFFATIMSGVVLEERICFKCKEEMNFIHYYRNNLSEMTIQQLEKIWKSPHIQLFCCRCYTKELLFKKWRKKTRTIY